MEPPLQLAPFLLQLFPKLLHDGTVLVPFVAGGRELPDSAFVAQINYLGQAKLGRTTPETRSARASR